MQPTSFVRLNVVKRANLEVLPVTTHAHVRPAANLATANLDCVEHLRQKRFMGRLPTARSSRSASANRRFAIQSIEHFHFIGRRSIF